MPKNPYLIENKKPVEEVREIPTYQPKYTDEEVAKLKEIFIAEQKEAIKKYQIKTSPLSPEARNRVIRKWGGGYQSWQATRDIWMPDVYGPYEEWVRLVIPCPAKNCSSMANKEVSNWIHKRSQCQSDFERHLEWSTEARVKCSYCENPSHIMNWSFKCHNHVEYHQMDGMKFNRAIVSAINYGSINSKFSTDLLKWFEDHPF